MQQMSQTSQKFQQPWQQDPRLARFTHSLGQTRFEIRSQTKFSMEGMGGRNPCVVIKGIDLKIGYNIMVVLIANEIQPKSCLDNEVLHHEMRHVSINQKYLGEIVSGLNHDVREFSANGLVFRGPTIDAAQSHAKETINSIIQPWIQRLDRNLSRGHQTIDTPQEYERMSSLCGGEAQNIIRNARSHIAK